MSETVATAAALLKEWYTDDRVEVLSYKTNPLHALLAKEDNFTGDVLPVPMIFGDPQAGSADIAVALAGKTPTLSTAFQISRKSDYSIASIAREAVMASRDNKGAFMRLAKANTDGAMRTAIRSISIAEYGSGTGRRGQISAGSNVGTPTITLADPRDATNFEKNMRVQLSATNGGGTLRSAGAIAVIQSVDRDAGTLTLAGNWSASIAAAAAGDFIFRAGDYDAMPMGLQGYLPASAPTSTLFLGVDRSQDPSRLGGVRHNGLSQPIDEALIDLASKIAVEGGAPDYCFVNNAQYRALQKLLGSKVQYTRAEAATKAGAVIGFDAIKIQGDAGEIKVIADRNCPSQVGFMLTLNTWKLYSLDPAPHIFDRGSDQEMLREAGADRYELRIGYYAQLACNAPGWNGRVSLPVAA